MVIDETIAKKVMENFKNFHHHSTIKAATLNFIGSQLTTKKEREDLSKVFKALDRNGDGHLTRAEIQSGFQRLIGHKVSDHDINEMFNAVDTDQSGYIEYSEFVVACTDRSAMLSDDRLKIAFNMLDKDGSGSISTRDIKVALGKDLLSDRGWDKLMKQIDA